MDKEDLGFILCFVVIGASFVVAEVMGLLFDYIYMLLFLALTLWALLRVAEKMLDIFIKNKQYERLEEGEP
ncbi:MAG: hypothetical protein KGD60_15695 [Candidatus Thorarchaeota archaeon]|nr:hypothetical protein [Candidatus Thorarchaeota archaeon]